MWYLGQNKETTPTQLNVQFHISGRYYLHTYNDITGRGLTEKNTNRNGGKYVKFYISKHSFDTDDPVMTLESFKRRLLVKKYIKGKFQNPFLLNTINNLFSSLNFFKLI